MPTRPQKSKRLSISWRQVPWMMRWLFSVVPSKYTFRSGVKLEFDGLLFEGLKISEELFMTLDISFKFPLSVL